MQAVLRYVGASQQEASRQAELAASNPKADAGSLSPVLAGLHLTGETL